MSDKKFGHSGKKNVIDLTWHRFGGWTIIGLAGENQFQQSLWNCRCDCGKKRIVLGNNLRHGKSQNCGCLRNKSTIQRLKLEFGLHAKHKAFQAIKSRCRIKHLEFSITLDQFLSLAEHPCHYCGSEPSNKISGSNGNFIYHGLDRVDSLKGYSIGNVVTCCKHCNIAKHSMTQEEFLSWNKRVYFYGLHPKK